MGVTDIFDEFIKKKQENCDHNPNDVYGPPGKRFCSNCSLEIKDLV